MDLTRLLLIVGGGYFVLKALGVDLLQGIGPIQDTEPVEEGDVVNTNLPGQPNGETPPVDEEISLSEAMMSVAVGLPQYQSGGNMMGYDHWGWVYHDVTGIKAPDWETVVYVPFNGDTGYAEAKRAQVMTLEQFLGLITTGGVGGLGAIEAAGYERLGVTIQ